MLNERLKSMLMLVNPLPWYWSFDSILSADQKANWKSEVQSLAHAYNCTINDSTGFSPFHLMFGRKPPSVTVMIALSYPRRPLTVHSYVLLGLPDEILHLSFCERVLHLATPGDPSHGRMNGKWASWVG